MISNGFICVELDYMREIRIFQIQNLKNYFNQLVKQNLHYSKFRLNTKLSVIPTIAIANPTLHTTRYINFKKEPDSKSGHFETPHFQKYIKNRRQTTHFEPKLKDLFAISNKNRFVYQKSLFFQ